MAEAITYADLRFVKAPLKKSVSIRMGQGQDPEADEDGELTYENVQVTPAPGGPSSLVSSGPDAGRTPCWHYLLLCLLLTCLLLGVAATCLGVRYLQASQQLQQMNRVLEATNSSLRQQLRLKITQLGQREEDLQGSRRELARSREALQAEERVHQAAEEQLQACQSDREKTNKSLQDEKEHRSTLEQQLSSIQDTLKPLLPCQSQDTCCPVGWIQYSKSCFYFSPTRKSWQMSKNLCESLSSKLATFSETYQTSLFQHIRSSLFSSVDSEDSYWISKDVNWQRTHHSVSYSRIQRCVKLQKSWPWHIKPERIQQEMETCSTTLPCICEMAAFRFPDGHH